ncbi:potassium transporter TrkG [Castellaniella sp. GW247-6E4]|uniref:TrkH family potassium uptake protein n=1 Tax=Castellaniella sp. GW247-6E4 TaxID=3140380 RepID=UPI003314EB32
MARLFSITPYQALRKARRTGQLQASPPAVLAGSFIVLILIGTLLLVLPFAQQRPFGWFEAFFTATSSVTVTGLTLIDPSRDLTRFGQFVVLALVQIGGLGFVTFAIIAALTLGKRVSLRYQALALEAFNQTSVSRIRQTALSVLKFSLAIELAAALILMLWWWRHAPLPHAAWMALFHAISAFNNAGVSLYDNSLALFSHDPVVTFVLSSCIILGGLGFTVLADIYHKQSWQKFTHYSRLILLGTLVLNLAGFGVFWAIETSNDATLGSLPLAQQGLASWMQVVSTRTAGFTSLDITQLRESSLLLLIMLMFIGGGSLSTASGIKLGTFIVLLAVVRSYILQRREVVLMHRSLGAETIQKALALLVVSGALVCAGTFLICLIENKPFLLILFAVVATFSTAGMDPGLTLEFSTTSHVLMIMLMFIGRLGPLTLVYSLGTQRHSRVRYPEAQMQVG